MARPINQSPQIMIPEIKIVNHINAEKKEAGGHVPGRFMYLTLEGLLHHGMMYRKDPQGAPVYQSTYLIGVLAGAAFGLYDAAYKGNQTVGFQRRASAFAEGSFTDKVMVVAESLMQGPLALAAAENFQIDGNFHAGCLVAGAWGFRLGTDLSHLTYQYFFDAKKTDGGN